MRKPKNDVFIAFSDNWITWSAVQPFFEPNRICYFWTWIGIQKHIFEYFSWFLKHVHIKDTLRQIRIKNKMSHEKAVSTCKSKYKGKIAVVDDRELYIWLGHQSLYDSFFVDFKQNSIIDDFQMIQKDDNLLKFYRVANLNKTFLVLLSFFFSEAKPRCHLSVSFINSLRKGSLKDGSAVYVANLRFLVVKNFHSFGIQTLELQNFSNSSIYEYFSHWNVFDHIFYTVTLTRCRVR